MDNTPRLDSSRTNISPASFVPDPIGGWICPHCMSTPHHLRAPGSFSYHPPSEEYVAEHFAICFGVQWSLQFQHTVEQAGSSSQSPPLSPFNYPFQDVQQVQRAPQPNAGCGSPIFSANEATVHDNALAPTTSINPLEYGFPAEHQPPSSKLNMSRRSTQGYDHKSSLPPSMFRSSIADCMAATFARTVDGNQNAGPDVPAAKRLARSQSKSDDEEPLTFPEDKHIVTDYTFFLTQQLRICHLKDQDRKTRGGKRDKLDIGYGGLECRHCAARNGISSGGGSRKFFWTNVDRLANSFSEISAHLTKCPACPVHIVATLHELKRTHIHQMGNFPRGSQKVFFRRIWRRLHPSDEATVDASAEAATRSLSPSSQEVIGSEHEDGPREREKRVAKCPTNNGSRTGIPLATPSDKHWLSDIDCSVRCSLEVFCASEADVTTYELAQSHAIRPKQVGLRCVYCASTPKGASGSAVMFPRSIYLIFERVRDFQRAHLRTCPNIPNRERSRLSRLETSTKSLSSISRRYYMVAAQNLGMYDTADGISVQGPIKSGQSAVLDSNVCQAETHKSSHFDKDASFSPNIHAPDIDLLFLDEAKNCRKRKALSPSHGYVIGDPARKKTAIDDTTRDNLKTPQTLRDDMFCCDDDVFERLRR